jgi:hypothetical protein
MPLLHGAYAESLFNSYTHFAWYYHLLFFIGVFFLSLVFHELTHLIVFLLNGYQNEVLIILFLVFYKKNQKWRLKVDFKLLLLGGGIVFPNLGSIEDEAAFSRARKAVERSLLAAPLFTLISSTTLFILSFTIFYRNGFLVPVSLYGLFVGAFFTYLSAKEAPQMYGDFKAYKKIKTDDLFALATIQQYTTNLSTYQKGLMEEYLKDQLPIKNDLTALTFFINLLDHAIFEENEVNLFLYEKVSYYALNPSSFRRVLSSPLNAEFAQAVIFYLDRLNFKTEALKLKELFFNHLASLNKKEKMKTYLTKQTDHILGLSDEKEFLNDSKNFNKGLLTFLFKNIPSFLASEQVRNDGYKPLKLYCPLK